MADIIISIASKVAEYLVAPIGRQLGYLFNYHSNLDDLKIQLEKLEDVKIEVKRDVVDSTRNGEEIKPVVEKWLRSVDGITEKAGEILLENEDKAKKRCLNGLCPNLKSCYQLSKKAKKTAKEVVKIQDGGKFERVSNRPAPQGTIRSAPIKGYEDFESRMSTLREIMEALRNPNINMIGVYGMGGVGKTMLVKEVARKAKEDELFDEVVMAVVSQPPNIKKIQEEIGRPLGLILEPQEIDSERAGRLCRRLKQVNSILIILDDVWAQLDLEAIGIPSRDIHKGCKIVVTSRRLELLSNQMNIQNNFKIEELHKEEAWNLFKKMAGDSVEDPEIEPTARKVAKECAGLPIAIAVVATALKNKIPSVWKDALVQLQTAAPITIEGMDDKVYKSLGWSYDFLKSDAAKKLFLLCSILPEDYQFSIQELLYYGNGFGLFQGIQALEVARNRVHALVEQLKASCLLLDGYTSGLFKMHDVVRDVGISVASKDKQMLVVRNEVALEEWTREEQLRSCSAISLPYIDIHELPTGFESPALKFFLFYSSLKGSSKIPDSFFGGMKQLKVLTLRNMHFSSLPSSLHFPSSLQTLCLDWCQLGDISIIGELKKLEILTFRRSDIEELPREIGQLTRLKLLDLRDCRALKVIPSNVIGRLCQLEELYMRDSFDRWEVDGNASLAELKQLSRLVTLEIYIRDANILPNDLVFEKLTRYQIFIGDFRNWSDDYEISRIGLNLADNTSIHLLSGINKLLLRTEDLHLEELNGFKSILNDSDGEGFHGTRRLHVESSSEIEYVIDKSVPFNAFPKLESLWLGNLVSLKEICDGQLTAESFPNLRKVEVEFCDRLQNLFPLSVARRLSKLQEIEISFCKNMDGIVAEGREAAEDNYGAVVPQLRSLELYSLPKLVSFCSKVKAVPCTSDAGSKEIISISEGKNGISIPLFNEKVAFPNLEELTLWLLPRLMAVWMKDSQGSLIFQKLSSLDIRNCESLINVFTTSMAQFQDMVEEINEKEAAAIDKIMFPQVKSLTLIYLKQLKIFCEGIHILEWPSLKKLKMSACHNVEIFASELSTFKETRGKAKLGTPTKQPLFLVDKVAFPNLEEMELNDMSSMEMIWQGQFHAHSFHKLRVLKVEKCDKILKVFPISLFRNLHNLEELSVKDCCSLEDVFELEGGVGETEHAFTFPPLKNLMLIGLPKLMHLWKEDSQLSAVFQNLRFLEVRSCGSLTHVFPSKIAEGPVQIERTTVAGDKGEATDETTFSQLYSLKLKDLLNLTSFCPGGNDFSFPSLEKVFVEECPKLKIFSPNSLCTPKLEKVQVEEGKWLWDGDLNTTIQHLFKQKMESIPFTMQGVWSNDPASQLEATTQFRKLVSNERGPSIDEVIKAGVVPRFVEFLGRQDLPQLQLEAAWALANVASGTSEHARVVIEHGAVPKFLQLLSSASDDVREQAVWGLGYFGWVSPSFRELVLGHGALMPLLAQLNEHSKLSMLRTATRTLAVFCCGKPPTPFEQVKPALPVLRQLIHLNDEVVLKDACWALSYLSVGPNDKIQAVIEAGVCPRLMELLLQPLPPKVLMPAFRTVGNIAMGDDTQTQFVIDNQVLPCLYQLLTQNLEKSITEHACWTISNITRRNRDQIQAVIEANIIPPLVHLLQHAEFDIKKWAAWAILNATSGGSHEQIQFLVSKGCIKPLCDLLVCPEPTVVTACLEGLENILKVSEADKEMGLNGGINLYAQKIDECEGLDKLENLQTHDNNDISKKAVKLLRRYWAEKDDEVQNPQDG